MKNIIIADDSPTVRKTAEIALAGSDYNFIHAENGADALAKVKDLFDRGEKVGRHVPSLTGIGKNGNRFLVVFDQDANLPISPQRLEADLLADFELQHFGMGMQ